MKKLAVVIVLALLAPCAAMAQGTPKAPPSPQPLREFTPQERWARAADQLTVIFVSMIALGKQSGRSPDDTAKGVAALAGPTWGNTLNPGGMVRGIRTNLLIWPQADVQVLEATETAGRIRFNRPWAEAFARTGDVLGVKLEEMDRAWEIFHRLVAEDHGLALDQQREGDYTVWTIRKK